jgi:Protein of unknown function (DUF1161)
MPIATHHLVLAATFMVAGGHAQAISCEELRASVEAKIQSKGVKNFNVAILEAGVSTPGHVVGTCEKGAKKLIYSQGVASSAAPPPTPNQQPLSPAPKPGVITECADGRVITQGSCKR